MFVYGFGDLLMNQQLIYLTISEGSKQVKIDGDFGLFTQLLDSLDRRALQDALTPNFQERGGMNEPSKPKIQAPAASR